MSTYDNWRTDDAPAYADLVEQVADLQRELTRAEDEHRRDREAAIDALHTRAVEADALRARVAQLEAERSAVVAELRRRAADAVGLAAALEGFDAASHHAEAAGAAYEAAAELVERGGR